MRERDLERKLVSHARKHGVLSFKFTSPSFRGVPDRIFIGHKGVLFLELKVGTNKPTPLQERCIDLICAAGGNALWVNNLEDALAAIEQHCGFAK